MNRFFELLVFYAKWIHELRRDTMKLRAELELYVFSRKQEILRTTKDGLESKKNGV